MTQVSWAETRPLRLFYIPSDVFKGTNTKDSLLFIHSTKRKNYNYKFILINLDKTYLEKYFAFIVRTIISK